MIPYWHITTIQLGPIPLQVWGLLVALGILVGAKVATILAKKRGHEEKIIWDLTFWVILGAMLFARLFHVFYEPQLYLTFPAQIFSLWHGGFSIMGGFFGAVLFGIFYLRKKHVDVWAYSDTAIFGLPVGLFIGRIGCFLIHDHPGTFTDFAMGVQYPEGVRHDHGLYLSLNGLILALVFLWMFKRKVKTGSYIVVFLIWYGVVRFFLDFLRATDGSIVDVRYLGLTPAQYFSIAMFLGGLYFLKTKILSKKN